MRICMVRVRRKMTTDREIRDGVSVLKVKGIYDGEKVVLFEPLPLPPTHVLGSLAPIRKICYPCG